MHQAKIFCMVAGSFTWLQGALAQRLEWQSAPRMVLERQFAGPLTDTLIQRLRDPVDGSVCYIYLPISAAHTPKTDTGYVQYGPNAIGTISCAISAQRPAAKPTDPKK
jgi:hypothetical protein